MRFDYDYIVIGSGFGGSVAALRLIEKGYSVCVIERGRRWQDEDYAKTNWLLWKWLWMPNLFCTGIQSLTFLRNALVLSGSGVGGGSLVYAAVLLEPPRSFFDDPQWKDLQKDWQKTLAPFFQTARRMLAVTANPQLWQSDELLREYAQDIGREHCFQPTDVGIYFGDPENFKPDPYFGGDGPPRKGCNHCGRCMVGCSQGGKNSLDRNYLYLAEKLGAKIVPETEAVDISPLPGGGYRIESKKSSGIIRSRKKSLTCSGIIVAAGALGTNELLLKCKQKGSLPDLSPQLGKIVRTNSEVLVGATSTKRSANFSKGIAITSSLFVTNNTHIEPVRYPEKSDAMCWLATLMTDGAGRLSRPFQFLWNCLQHPLLFLKTLNPIHWAKKTIILLVMQNYDNRLDLSLERKWYWPFSKMLSSHWPSSSIPTYIPEANQAARAIAKKIDGYASSSITEVLLNMPLSAHIIGGCVIGKDRDHGVVDSTCKVFGYENFYIVDGAAIPANLGVNPSLTITAIAEYAMSHFAMKDPYNE
ncbi:GMC family oxidoreductase [candidate division KSB1 bacterium]|nr:GMC family oxidoreductase [candidate division KSB1 bacterium]RQW09619.1 MAG: GMC family oxidoreductase [candidate division KSB1 bacterium]